MTQHKSPSLVLCPDLPQGWMNASHPGGSSPGSRQSPAQLVFVPKQISAINWHPSPLNPGLTQLREILHRRGCRGRENLFNPHPALLNKPLDSPSHSSLSPSFPSLKANVINREPDNDTAVQLPPYQRRKLSLSLDPLLLLFL